MFSKARSQADPVKAPNRKPRVPSIVSEDLRIVGNLTTDGDIQLDGIVDGDISTKKLTVGIGAIVNGVIVGDDIVVAGTVNGEITARAIRLTRTAKVTGDINHDSLSIEAGAYVQGLCRRIDKKRHEGSATVTGSPDMPKMSIPGKVVPVAE